MTARPSFGIIFRATAVPRAAAAVLTRLLLSRTVASNRSGRAISCSTSLALRRPMLMRCSSLALERAMKAVSEEEKNADKNKQRTRRANLPKSPDSILKPSGLLKL